MPFEATWMDLEIVIRSEESQKQTYGLQVESKKGGHMNLFVEQKQSDRCRKINLWLPGKNGGYQEIGIDLYILLYIKQITNKDLVYSILNICICMSQFVVHT